MEKKPKKLYIISGSSGVGKGTVIKAFLEKHPEFALSVSCTTRNPRQGEIDGVNYFFLSKTDFMKCVDNGEFLEWAEFSDNCYGTKKEFVNNTLKNNDLILEIDTQGALQVKKQMPEAVLIFIAPPSYQDLEFRLRNRKTEDEETIQKRLDAVKMEIENSKYFDYLVTNDLVENAVSEIERIVKYDGVY